MHRFLVFAGTTEGRLAIEHLLNFDEVELFASVATEYGKEFLPQDGRVTVLADRLNVTQMHHLMAIAPFDCVIDATHPYAAEATNNILAACQSTQTACLRISRAETPYEGLHIVPTIEDAIAYLCDFEGNILTTTGSKDLELFTQIPDFSKRVFIRILPTIEALQHALDLGYSGKNIICMQGPFSKEQNVVLLEQVGANMLVTKNSGEIGGFLNKVRAAQQTGIETLVIGRPLQIAGVALETALEKLETEYNLKRAAKT